MRNGKQNFGEKNNNCYLTIARYNAQHRNEEEFEDNFLELQRTEAKENDICEKTFITPINHIGVVINHQYP